MLVRSSCSLQAVVSFLKIEASPTLFVCVQLIAAVVIWLTVAFNWESFLCRLRSIITTSRMTPFFEVLLPILAGYVGLLTYLGGIIAVVALVKHDSDCTWTRNKQDTSDPDWKCQNRQTVALLWCTETVCFALVLIWKMGYHCGGQAEQPQPQPPRPTPRGRQNGEWTATVHSAGAFNSGHQRGDSRHLMVFVEPSDVVTREILFPGGYRDQLSQLQHQRHEARYVRNLQQMMALTGQLRHTQQLRIPTAAGQALR